ncbi:MAG: hypothetical protein M3P98_01995 [bacterium]|nr:hypothetical protein [bacterium]
MARQIASTGEIVQDDKKTSDAGKNDELYLYVKIYSPFKTYYDGIAKSVSAENDTGPFDILPKHHNFMALLIPCTIVIRSKDKKIEKQIRITRGVMHVRQNKVTVFLDV